MPPPPEAPREFSRYGSDPEQAARARQQAIALISRALPAINENLETILASIRQAIAQRRGA